MKGCNGQNPMVPLSSGVVGPFLDETVVFLVVVNVVVGSRYELIEKVGVVTAWSWQKITLPSKYSFSRSVVVVVDDDVAVVVVVLSISSSYSSEMARVWKIDFEHNKSKATYYFKVFEIAFLFHRAI